MGYWPRCFDWPVYALAATAMSGMMLVQIAFASGPLPPAVAAMSVTNPVASFVLGILAFDAPAPRDPAVLSAIAVSGVLIAVGIVGLANASSTRRLFRAEADSGDYCGHRRWPPETTGPLNLGRSTHAPGPSR